MDPVTISYYCIKGGTSIASLAIQYKKLQELSNISSSIERAQLVNMGILDYTRLIQENIQSFMHIYFKSAYENLNYALNSDGDNQISYLKQARNRFIDAASIERNENLILSYLGLAMCQVMLDDVANSKISINKIKTVNFIFDEKECLEKYSRLLLIACDIINSQIRIDDYFDNHYNNPRKLHNFLLPHISNSPENAKFIQREDVKYFFKILKGYGGWSGTSLELALKEFARADFEKMKISILNPFTLCHID